MPDFSAEERAILSADELDLSTRSRQPQLREQSDAALAKLIEDLRTARTQATTAEADIPAPADGSPAPRGRAAYLETAFRRASNERNRRRKLTQSASTGNAVQEASEDDAGRGVSPQPARKPVTRRARPARGNQKTTDRRGGGPRKAAPQKTTRKSETSVASIPASTTAANAKDGIVVAKQPKPAAPKGQRAASKAAPAIKASTQKVEAKTKPDGKPAETRPSATAAAPKAATKSERKALTAKAERRAEKAEKAKAKADKAAAKAARTEKKKHVAAAEAAKEKARKAKRKAQKTARLVRKASADDKA